jgi:hypothetical protein
MAPDLASRSIRNVKRSAEDETQKMWANTPYLVTT